MLDVEDLFEAVISCDYAHPTFRCKPEREYYEEAMEHTGVHDSGRIFFVDDSALNVRGAIEMGWNVVLFDEDGSEAKKEAAEAIPREKIISKLDGALASSHYVGLSTAECDAQSSSRSGARTSSFLNRRKSRWTVRHPKSSRLRVKTCKMSNAGRHRVQQRDHQTLSTSSTRSARHDPISASSKEGYICAGGQHESSSLC